MGFTERELKRISAAMRHDKQSNRTWTSTVSITRPSSHRGPGHHRGRLHFRVYRESVIVATIFSIPSSGSLDIRPTNCIKQKFIESRSRQPLA